jgi:prephenate dehydratase
VVEAGRRDEGALGTVLAAEIYGGVVLREGVQDRDDNETRFAWIARADDSSAVGASVLRAEREREPRKTSLVFWGPGADSPGWLVRCLDQFSRRAINLTKIESRPKRERMGHYMFFVDLQGSARDAPVAQALEGLHEICEVVRVLGDYHAAATRAEGGDSGGSAVHSGASDG